MMRRSAEKIRVLAIMATNNTGGPGKGLFQLIERLDKEVHYTVCNFRHPQQESFEFLDEAQAKGVQIRLIEQRFAFDPTMIRSALRIARESGFDIIQSHGNKTHALGWITARRLGIPWVAVSHGWTAETLKVKIYNVIGKLMMKLADSAISVSPALHSETVALRGKSRSVMILNAIEQSEIASTSAGTLRKALGFSDNDFVIGVFGRLSHEKGQDLLINALARLSPGSPATVAFVGEGATKDALAVEARKLGIEKRVRFLGYQKNVLDYFRAADLCVLPSRAEGLPNVLLEAQLTGCPIVAFDVGGVREVVVDGKTGFLVPPGDVEALAERIDWAIQNKHELREISNNARKSLFPRFSVERRCNEFMSEYEWLLNDERRGLVGNEEIQ